MMMMMMMMNLSCSYTEHFRCYFVRVHIVVIFLRYFVDMHVIFTLVFDFVCCLIHDCKYFT